MTLTPTSITPRAPRAAASKLPSILDEWPPLIVHMFQHFFFLKTANRQTFQTPKPSVLQYLAVAILSACLDALHTLPHRRHGHFHWITDRTWTNTNLKAVVVQLFWKPRGLASGLQNLLTLLHCTNGSAPIVLTRILKQWHSCSGRLEASPEISRTF
jgi:hypothetical protein